MSESSVQGVRAYDLGLYARSASIRDLLSQAIPQLTPSTVPPQTSQSCVHGHTGSCSSKIHVRVAAGNLSSDPCTSSGLCTESKPACSVVRTRQGTWLIFQWPSLATWSFMFVKRKLMVPPISTFSVCHPTILLRLKRNAQPGTPNTLKQSVPR